MSPIAVLCSHRVFVERRACDDGVKADVVQVDGNEGKQKNDRAKQESF